MTNNAQPDTGRQHVTPTEFLLARVGEDEAVAQYTGGRHGGICWSAYGGQDEPETLWFRSRWDTARVLAECEAKRQIVAEHGMGNDPCNTGVDLPDPPPCGVLRALVAIFADHPDCRDEWKPGAASAPPTLSCEQGNVDE